MNFGVYLRILSYIKPYISTVIVTVVLSVLISILHFGSLGMIKPLGDILFGKGGEHLIQQLNNAGFPGIAAFLKTHVLSDPYRSLYILMIIAMAMVILKNLLRFIQEYITGYITAKVTIDISNQLFQSTQKLPIKYFSKEGTSQISARFINDISLMGRGVKSVFGKAIREPLKALGTLGLALMINWKLTLLACLVFPTAGIFLKSIGRRVKRGAKKTLIKQGNIMSLLDETFSGMKIVKAYRMEDRISENFAKENKKLLRYQMKVIAADAITSPIMEVFVTGAGILMLILSAHMVLNGDMSSGDFCAFYAALGALFDPVRKLADLNNQVNASIAAGERVFELMDQKIEIEEAANAMVLPQLQNEIKFDHVYFSYEPGKPVLEDLCFSVKHGEHIAIVGRSGAGKSTLVSLLLRLYDVDQGKILIDGNDIRQATFASLLDQIGLVTQEAFLFNDTIANNIASKNGQACREMIVKAAQDSYSDIFINNLQQQYETIYGAGGVDLSGGQKHRVSLARAIFKQPRILILDEAMANLDAESEDYILNALEKFTQGRTTFIIAHRFSTITQVDRIVVLDEGRLAGFGTHSELLQQSDVYRNLYERQTLK